MKKVVSILLTASMIACSAALPLTAIAAETTSVTTTTMTAVDDPIVQTAVVTVTIMDISGDNVLVKPVDGSPELKSSSKFSLSAKQLPAAITPKVGMKLEITYNGGILETYPAQFGNVQKIVAVKDDTVKIDGILLKGTKDMTLNDVMRLAELGDELDWADFRDYNGRDVGSGLYIWEYKLEGGFVLDVGGDIQKKPLYILLSHDDDKGIDIRTNDVKEYIASMTVPVVNENETVTYKIITPPDKNVYKLGESINLKGIQVEVQKGDEKPVIYAYPDVAFDYQSNIPKAPTVTLSGDYKRDKVGTVAIKVIGSDDVLFNVEFVDDSAVKENSVMLTTESGDDGCYIHLDFMSGTFTMSGSIYQNFAVFGKFERKGNDLYLYAENGSTNVYVLHREDDHFISQSDESGIKLTKGLVFSAENDTFWEKLTSTNESTVKGDTNCDDQVDLSDAVMIMQALANPNKYGLDGTAEHHLTEQGKLNGDMNGDGLTSGDALAIQRKLLGLDDEEKSFSTTLLGIDKAKVIGVKVSSLPEGYDYSFTDENAQSVVDYLSNISLSTNLSVEDPGQLGGMTWVIRLVYENGDTVTLYDLGKFIHGTDRKWYEMTYEESQELSNLIWKLGQTDNDKSIDNSAIAGKIFAYEKEGAGGYCTLSFNENGRFLYSPGKLSSYMGGGDWKIDGDTVSLIGMVGKTIYLKITDDTLVYIAEGSDEFPYMDIKNGEKFGIYRPEISSDKFQLNSRYTEYGLGDPKVELNLIASELPEFCYVENVRLYDEDDNFIGTMSPAMDADIWSYLVDCHVTEECSKTYYTLTKIRCGQKTYLDDVRSEITVNFKDTPAPKIDNSEYLFGNEPSGSVMTPQRLALNCNSFCANGETLNVKMLMGDKYTYNQEHNSYPNYDSEGYPEYSIFATENFKKLDDERLIINGKKSEFTKIFSKDDMKSLDISQKEGDYSSYYNDTAEIDFSNYASGSTGCISFRFGWKADGENPLNPKSDFTGTSQTMYFYVGENGTGISINGAEAAKKAYDEKSDIDIMFYDSPYVKWNDKEVMSNLYEKLRKPNNEKLAINFKLSPSPDYDYKYNGKTLAEYANADYTEEMDKLRDLLMYGNQLQYGENLYTTGMPDGTKRTKEWYDERVEYFGKELLSKYIVDGIFLEETLRSDINELMKKHRSDYSEAEKAYYRYIADKAIKQLDEQNIKYEYMTDPKRLVIYVTADEFKSLTIDNVSRYGLDTSVASGLTVDAVF